MPLLWFYYLPSLFRPSCYFLALYRLSVDQAIQQGIELMLVYSHMFTFMVLAYITESRLQLTYSLRCALIIRKQLAQGIPVRIGPRDVSHLSMLCAVMRMGNGYVLPLH